MNTKTFAGASPGVDSQGRPISTTRAKFLVVESAVKRFTRNMKGVDVVTHDWEFGVRWRKTWYRGDASTNFVATIPVEYKCGLRVLASDYGLSLIIKRDDGSGPQHWESGPNLHQLESREAAQALVRWLDRELP